MPPIFKSTFILIVFLTSATVARIGNPIASLPKALAMKLSLTPHLLLSSTSADNVVCYQLVDT